MKLGIVDTMFSRVNMGEIAIDEIKNNYPEVEILRRTVPGVKDLSVECKKLMDNNGCDVCLALGMVGGAKIDTQCAHEGSLSTQEAKLKTNKHIIEVFIHENEAWSPQEFIDICNNRIRKHAHNAVWLVQSPEKLIERAGTGARQGKEDEGPVNPEEKIGLGIVVARFNNEITDKMREVSVNYANSKGALTKVKTVPGVYDMPLVVNKMLMDKQLNAIVVLGAVVKGDTAHDQVITNDVAKRLGELSLEFKKPITLGIIGHGATYEDAEKRAEEYAERATDAALELVQTLRE